MLSEEEKQDYVDHGGLHCPYCGHRNVEAGQMDIDGPYASQDVRCLHCEAEWKDLFTLTDIEEVYEPDEDVPPDEYEEEEVSP